MLDNKSLPFIDNYNSYVVSIPVDFFSFVGSSAQLKLMIAFVVVNYVLVIINQELIGFSGSSNAGAAGAVALLRRVRAAVHTQRRLPRLLSRPRQGRAAGPARPDGGHHPDDRRLLFPLPAAALQRATIGSPFPISTSLSKLAALRHSGKLKATQSRATGPPPPPASRRGAKSLDNVVGQRSAIQIRKR